ncbi:MAG TPA: DUF2911 domain-containing protein [Candidatus Limnocylindrales bacterium]|nr:DUF2911 domain-containing protein [Candidatus Limnocylindrales bacterium]
MRNYLLQLSLLIASLCLAAPFAGAQSALLDLPRASQHATVMQRVGLTSITINYHRPLVNGRKIWGGLVPYGQVWRAGANENTTIEFTDPVMVEGKPLAAGIYGLHMLPAENEWAIIFSRTSTAWGSFSYDQKEDALRVNVKPGPSGFHEALTYDFDGPTPNATTITLRWEKLAVPFKVEVNTKEIVAASLHKQFRGLAQYNFQSWDDAANYFADNKTDLEEALKYSNRSIQMEERFDNLMTKARILDELDRKQEAGSARTRAMALATPIQLHIYGRQLQAQGRQEQAFEVFRANIRKNPNHWTAHNESARLASSQGKFDEAAKEMRASLADSPDPIKPQVEALIKKLEAKQDINP